MSRWILPSLALLLPIQSAIAAGAAVRPPEPFLTARLDRSETPGTLLAKPDIEPAGSTRSSHDFDEGEQVDVHGALYSSRDGRIVLKSESDGLFVLLENQNLWRMEQRAAFGERQFTVRGRVSKYQERYYLTVTKILQGAGKASDASGEPDERPFWERLMFWKSS